jgi:hypothetical protein
MNSTTLSTQSKVMLCAVAVLAIAPWILPSLWHLPNPSLIALLYGLMGLLGLYFPVDCYHWSQTHNQRFPTGFVALMAILVASSLPVLFLLVMGFGMAHQDENTKFGLAVLEPVWLLNLAAVAVLGLVTLIVGIVQLFRLKQDH